MPIETNCPACGAQLSVGDRGGSVTCPYCSNHFEVDMSGVQPAFKAVENAAEAPQEPQTIEPAPPAIDYYSSAEPSGQPLTGEVIPPNLGGRQVAGFFSGRWWLIIALAVAGVFCLSCACLVIVLQRVIH